MGLPDITELKIPRLRSSVSLGMMDRLQIILQGLATGSPPGCLEQALSRKTSGTPGCSYFWVPGGRTRAGFALIPLPCTGQSTGLMWAMGRSADVICLRHNGVCGTFFLGF